MLSNTFYTIDSEHNITQPKQQNESSRVGFPWRHTQNREPEAALNLIPLSPLSTFTAGYTPSRVLLQGK